MMPETALAFDVQRVRADFPILARAVRGKPLVYLDNAATTQKPQAVLDALTRYYTDINARDRRVRGGARARPPLLQRIEYERNRLHAQRHRKHQSRCAELRPSSAPRRG